MHAQWYARRHVQILMHSILAYVCSIDYVHDLIKSIENKSLTNVL